jgi:hypothetical protein
VKFFDLTIHIAGAARLLIVKSFIKTRNRLLLRCTDLVGVNLLMRGKFLNGLISTQSSK